MRRQRKKLMGDINVVPYIDVMLVLLVIFMITAPLLQQGVNVNLPNAKAKTLSSNKAPMIVSVDKSGNYYLNTSHTPSTPLTSTQLVNLVREKQQQYSQVLVKGDRDANYGKVMQAMVLLQQAGVNKVGLVTQSPA